MIDVGRKARHHRLRRRLLAVVSAAVPLLTVAACSSSTSGGTATSGAGGAAGATAEMDANADTTDGDADGATLECPSPLTCFGDVVSCQCAIVCYAPGGDGTGAMFPPAPCLALDAPDLPGLLRAVGMGPSLPPNGSVVAGPSQEGGKCCYAGAWPVTGRPLYVGGANVVSRIARRADWQAS